jgi:thioredoxin 1
MKFGRRSTLLAFAVLGFAATLPAFALQGTKFSAAALAEAQKAGKPILVEISAPWCPTCKAQKPILSRLLSTDKFKSFVTLDMDFDSQKDDLKAVKAQMQSTLIVYKGTTEVGRSAGDTNPATIEALLAKAL